MILVEELDTEFGVIQIMRSKRDGTYTYHQDRCYHSQMNADGVSTCGYVHVMYSLIRQSAARHVLMIGGAGGTLATMLHRAGSEITVVDINPHAFSLAKRYFQMPDAIKCVVDDGWRYLSTTDQRYDAIAIDVFDSEGDVPEPFTQKSFFEVVKETLKPSGIVVMNVMVEDNRDMLADNIALNMSEARIPTALFDQPRRQKRNVIIAGGALDHLEIIADRKSSKINKELLGIIRREPKRRRACPDGVTSDDIQPTQSETT